MKYTKLGKNGPQVSTIGFGAWAIGGMNWGETDDEISLDALNQAIDQGVTLIDTADVYGFGHSEELVAKIIQQRGKDNLVIATKAGSDFYNSTPEDDKGYGPIRPNYGRDYLIFAAEQSLKRLGLEAIDILQLHSPDLETLQQDEPWLAMEQLKREGKVKYIGLSVQSFKENEQAHLLDLHHDLLDCIQVRYNLLERQAEERLFPKALNYGIGVIVRIPLLFGLLTGKFNKGSSFDQEDHRSMNLAPDKLQHYLNQWEQYQTVYQQYPDQSMAQVSLRFCLTHPACHTVIPGAKTAQQAVMNCQASDLGPLGEAF
jgi:aryl-alcohol dehydrogenase-like predicted oxidoreductase